MVIHNEDVRAISVEIPEGHKHLRAMIAFADGKELTFQEATIANLVRAYITIKTHPTMTRVQLQGKVLDDRKDGYAEWQLLEIK
jgi:hypothetical protein